MQITKKEYEEYIQLKKDKQNGKVFYPDTIRFVCEACNYNPETIGNYFLEELSKLRKDK